MKQERTERTQRNETAAGETYFAAANSGRGFVSFYESIFDTPTIKKRYIIQGGPGTGKSHFMREAAAYAEARGASVSYFRCSSDPDSLDGIILNGEIALMDGTAPHTVEPKYVGARDEIVNLGEFWDGERLGQCYNDIVSLNALKANSYGRAYRFLSAAMEVERVNRELVLPTLRQKKMEGAAGRLAKGIPRGDGYSLTPALMDSIGMKGSVRLDTYERQAKRLYVVDDHYGVGSYFLLSMMEEGRKKECAMQVSYQPLLPELPDALLFLQSGVCFLLGETGAREPDGRVNMKRFVDADRLSEIKVDLRINRRLADALLTSATEALSDAGEHHFELERIYASCMDFDALGKFSRSFFQRLA